MRVHSRGRARLALYATIVMVAAAACDDATGAAPADAGASASSRTGGGVPRDRSPHREGFARNGPVQLHYLDWGGSGPTLLLVPGLGDNAHVFDDLAPQLASRYRVIAMSPRGYGQSDHPANGYHVDTLADDIVAVLDRLKLQRVYLAGHSISAYAMTRLAARSPGRVARIAYIDGSIHDRTVECGPGAGRGGAAAAAASADDVQNPPPPTEADLASFRTYEDYERRTSVGPWTAARANNLAHQLVLDASSGRVVAPSTDPAIHGAMLMEACRYRLQFGALRMPALAIAARPGTIFDLYPWLPADVSGDSLAYAEMVLHFFNHVQGPADLAAFAAEAPRGATRVIEGSTHYVFFKNEAEVLDALRGFFPAHGHRRGRAEGT